MKQWKHLGYMYVLRYDSTNITDNYVTCDILKFQCETHTSQKYTSFKRCIQYICRKVKHIYRSRVVIDWYFHEVKTRTLRSVPGYVSAMLDFVKDPAAATFDGSGGIENVPLSSSDTDSKSSPDLGGRDKYPWQRRIGSFLRLAVWAEMRKRNVTEQVYASLLKPDFMVMRVE